MPNWCRNEMFFGSKSDAEKVWNGMQYDYKIYNNINNNLEVVDKTRFSFEMVMPSPTKKEECPEKYLVTGDSHIQLEAEKPWFDWYKWNYDNWGVKWDACDAYYDGHSCIYFDSPWSPPNKEIFARIAEKFNVEFTSNHEDGEGSYIPYDYFWFPNREDNYESENYELNNNEDSEEYYEEDSL